MANRQRVVVRAYPRDGWAMAQFGANKDVCEA